MAYVTDQLFLVIMASIIGALLGCFTGLVPGIHANTIAILLFSMTIILEGMFSSLSETIDVKILIVVAIASTSITHTFLNFIPGTIFGAPDEVHAVGVLPMHEMMMREKTRICEKCDRIHNTSFTEDRLEKINSLQEKTDFCKECKEADLKTIEDAPGYYAVYYSAIGSLYAALFCLLLIIPIKIVFGRESLAQDRGYDFLKDNMLFILFCISLILIFTDQIRLRKYKYHFKGKTYSIYAFKKAQAERKIKSLLGLKGIESVHELGEIDLGIKGRIAGLSSVIIIFLLSGAFGWVVLNQIEGYADSPLNPFLREQYGFYLPATTLFPAFTGLFGIATLLYAISTEAEIKKQSEGIRYVGSYKFLNFDHRHPHLGLNIQLYGKYCSLHQKEVYGVDGCSLCKARPIIFNEMELKGEKLTKEEKEERTQIENNVLWEYYCTTCHHWIEDETCNMGHKAVIKTEELNFLKRFLKRFLKLFTIMKVPEKICEACLTYCDEQGNPKCKCDMLEDSVNYQHSTIGAVAGGVAGLLPGVTAGVGTILGITAAKAVSYFKTKFMRIKNIILERIGITSLEKETEIIDFDENVSEINEFNARSENVIMTLAAVNTAASLVILAGLFVLLRPRNGTTIVINQMVDINEWFVINEMPLLLYYLLVGVLISIIIGFIFTSTIGTIVFDWIDYKKKTDPNFTVNTMRRLVIALFIMVWIFTGFVGLLVLIVGTFIGLLPPLLGTRKSHAMGFLLIPVMIFYYNMSGLGLFT